MEVVGSEKGGGLMRSRSLGAQEGKTALDFGQEGDDVKEALLSHRFSGEVSCHHSHLTTTPLTPPHNHTTHTSSSPHTTHSQELEDEYLQDRLPVLVERVVVREMMCL